MSSVLEMAKSKITMIDAGQRLGGITPESVRNFMTRGCKVGKKVVRLRGFRIGDRWFTTEKDLEDFLAVLNG